MQWQPIDTAPRDGTEILLWPRNHRGKYLKTVAQGYWHSRPRTKYEGVWVLRGGVQSNFTHWMPLPQPPTE